MYFYRQLCYMFCLFNMNVLYLKCLSSLKFLSLFEQLKYVARFDQYKVLAKT